MSRFEGLYQRSPIFLQTIFLNLKAFELYLERYGPKFWRSFEEFEQQQWMSESEIEAYQNERLGILIKHAYDTVPYYNRVMKDAKLRPDDIRSVRDLPKMPLLTREKIRHHRKELLSTAYPRILLRHGHTSGTTGSPLDLFYDTRTCMIHHVVDWRFKAWAGLQYGQPYASLQGRVTIPLRQSGPPLYRKNYLNNQLFLSSFHLKEEYLPYYFKHLSEHGVCAIEGYPSTIYILALFLQKKGQTFRLKSIFTSSETLFDYQRETIERTFQCKIFDSYGMAERAVFATECREHSGHHLNLDYGVTEFLNDQGEPVESGNLGRIVATSLHNSAMPFIRYVTNDASSSVKQRCPCGRVFPLMDAVATKDESIVTLPDGRLISPSVLTHPFKPMHNIVESQIIQEELGELTVKIVPNHNYSPQDESQLISAFAERLGPDVRIRVEYVESIPRTKNAKFKWVISRIKPAF